MMVQYEASELCASMTLFLWFVVDDDVVFVIVVACDWSWNDAE